MNSTSNEVAHTANTIASTATAEMNAASSLAKQTYANSAQEVTNGYNASVSALNSAMNQALLAAYKQAGNAMLNANRDKATRLANTFRNLDDEGLAALNRIVDAVTNQQITDSLNNDMQVLGRKLNLQNMGQPGSNVPNALANSNFGVQVDTTLGLGLGWRALDAEGFLKYPDFIEGLSNSTAMYHRRLMGGVLFFLGSFLLVLNLIMK